VAHAGGLRRPEGFRRRASRECTGLRGTPGRSPLGTSSSHSLRARALLPEASGERIRHLPTTTVNSWPPGSLRSDRRAASEIWRRCRCLPQGDASQRTGFRHPGRNRNRRRQL